jgi:formate hydrogenlyase subunit 3/multisubunit Na+/H+ antiporter MnhD subunit
MILLLLAMGLPVATGAAALFLSRWPGLATGCGAGGIFIGCLLGLVSTLRVLLSGTPIAWQRAWETTHGVFSVEVDALSAFFLLPVFGLSALAAVYGSDYWLAYRHSKALGGAWLFFSLFISGMALVLVARTVVLFLMAWEVMSVAAFCLVTFEQEKVEVRQAGWIYLIATHLGVIFLFIAFLLLGRHAGSLQFEVFRAMSGVGSGWSGPIFMLALVGFGTKAGLVPFHVWLPEAHPAAPSHVSALMSGVMIKMGIYGIMRILTFLEEPAGWWGLSWAGFGLLTSLVGVSLALHQRDMKRVLAYSSIENIGLISLALGLGLWGRASHTPAIAVLGTTAALLHIWNHSFMKGLMFLAAGSVLHGSGTKDMGKCGGLLKRMPWTGTLMLIGAVAIAALPPLNGFVSKWLIYLTLMQCGLTVDNGYNLAALLAVGVLALVGGMAALTFVRLTGMVLLGSPRSDAALHAHESSRWMIAPMLLLVLLCLIGAVMPQEVAELSFGVVNQIVSNDASPAVLRASGARIDVVGDFNAWILIGAALVAGLLLARTEVASQAYRSTWGCGFARPAKRMQYTGGSFAEIFAERLLPRFLRPRTTRTVSDDLFWSKSEFALSSADPFSDRGYLPLFRNLADRFSRLRVLQQGKVHVYLVYIMVVVVLSLGWASLRTWYWELP